MNAFPFLTPLVRSPCDKFWPSLYCEKSAFSCCVLHPCAIFPHWDTASRNSPVHFRTQCLCCLWHNTENCLFLSHPGVLFKALILLVKDYTQLYVHTRQINPNPTLINPTQPIRLELWKALRYYNHIFSYFYWSHLFGFCWCFVFVFFETQR